MFGCIISGIYDSIDIMMSIFIGIFSFIAVLFSVLNAPFGLGYLDEIVFVLKGAVPLVVAVFGILSIFIGITDILDKQHAKKEMELQAKIEKETEQAKDT